MSIGLGSVASVAITGGTEYTGMVLNARRMKLRLENDTEETTVFSPANNMKTWLPTKRRATLTVEGLLDGTTAPTSFDAEITKTTMRTPRTITVNFGATGAPRFSFSGFPKFSPRAVVDGVNTYTTTIKSTGAITGDVVP